MISFGKLKKQIFIVSNIKWMDLNRLKLRGQKPFRYFESFKSAPNVPILGMEPAEQSEIAIDIEAFWVPPGPLPRDLLERKSWNETME